MADNDDGTSTECNTSIMLVGSVAGGSEQAPADAASNSPAEASAVAEDVSTHIDPAVAGGEPAADGTASGDDDATAAHSGPGKWTRTSTSSVDILTLGFIFTEVDDASTVIESRCEEDDQPRLREGYPPLTTVADDNSFLEE